MRTQTGTYRTYTAMLEALPKIGRLQILGLSHKNKWGAYYLNCKCDCGASVSVGFTSLNISKTLSCGCLQKDAVKQTGTNNKKYTIDKDKLIDNNFTAYIAGLYGADGSNEKQSISLGLQSCDKDILEKISNYLGYTGPLYVMKRQKSNEQDQVRLTISDKDFRLFLENRGIIKNKTVDYIVPDQYLYNSHFWRGMVDGDGCLFKGVTLVGTKHTIDSFKLFCESILGKSVKPKPYKIKSCVNVYTINFIGKMYVPLLKALYENPVEDMYLQRKYEKYVTIISYYKQK